MLVKDPAAVAKCDARCPLGSLLAGIKRGCLNLSQQPLFVSRETFFILHLLNHCE